MKSTLLIAFISFTILFLASCQKVDTECMKGEVIGKIRSSGGGLAVSLNKNYKGTVTWQGHKNVIELLNIPDTYKTEGNTIYFQSRPTTDEDITPITADGDESIELILYGEKFSEHSCAF